MVFTDNQKFHDNSFIVFASIMLTQAQIGGVYFGHPLQKDQSFG